MNKEMVFELVGEELTTLFKKHKVLLAGGSIRSLYCSTLENAHEYEKENTVKDLDIYFKSKENIIELVKDLKELGYDIICETSNAITLGQEGHYPIQLIVLENTIGGAENIMKSFDFSVCSAVFDFELEEFFFDKHFKIDNKKRKLRFNTDTSFPIASLIRVGKYVKKKYSINNIEYLKIALSINRVKISSFEDLKLQLQGIDTLILKPVTDNLIDNQDYDMNEFLDKMNEYLESTINSSYNACIEKSSERTYTIEDEF